MTPEIELEAVAPAKSCRVPVPVPVNRNPMMRALPLVIVETPVAVNLFAVPAPKYWGMSDPLCLVKPVFLPHLLQGLSCNHPPRNRIYHSPDFPRNFYFFLNDSLLHDETPVGKSVAVMTRPIM